MTSTDPQPAVGRRRSRQREVLLDYLDRQVTFRTAQEIHTGLQEQGERVGLATVYRTLQLLSEGHEVDTLRTDSGEQSYRRCTTTGHHHHLICSSCGTVLEFDDAPVVTWVEKLCSSAGFTPQRHILEVVGVCQECTERLAP